MVMNRLSENTLINGVASSGTTSPLNTSVLDMDGFEGVLFMAFATATSTAQHLKVMMGTASATNTHSDATGRVEHSVFGLYLDVFRPIKRYVQGSFTASGASSPARSVVAIRYGTRSGPTSNASGDISTGSLALASPGSGTATG